MACLHGACTHRCTRQCTPCAAHRSSLHRPSAYPCLPPHSAKRSRALPLNPRVPELVEDLEQEGRLGRDREENKREQEEGMNRLCTGERLSGHLNSPDGWPGASKPLGEHRGGSASWKHI